MAILVVSAAPVAAQAPAALAPKVTINGLVDFVTTIYNNVADADVTNGGRDKGWYSRERGLFTLTGEVGRSKGVLALEIDFANGRIANAALLAPSGNGGFDIETDEKGQIEVKWLYLETPITGPGSLLPFIPVPSIGRFGAQPARGHDYKPGIHFTGDFPGATLETQWAPNIRSTLTYVQIDEALDPVNNPSGVVVTSGLPFNGGTEDWAILGSVEVGVFKGLTVKPTYSYVRYDGGNNALAPFGTEPKGGFAPAATTQANKSTTRHTFGGDVRWTVGPWSLAPTFLYQWGTQETVAATSGGKDEVDIRSWIFDVIGGYRSGPLTLEGRFVWTSGMKATKCVQTVGPCAGGSDIKYYQPINAGTIIYFAGWSEIESAGVDYQLPLQGGAVTGMKLGGNPSYDKYGRIIAAVAADYAFTPAFIGHLITAAHWTDEKVDTDGALNLAPTITQTNGITPANGGDSRYLGTEVNTGFTYRFAPNVAFDLIGAYLFAGPARDNARVTGGVSKDADDVYKLSARVRITW
jgi:hypothetical protein